MKVDFYKYHGTGNDFIIIRDADRSIEERIKPRIAELCHRRFGIGADGFIFIQDEPEFDFFMKYYNSDGRQSTMCGNGGRCIVHLARELGLIKNKATFLAVDGPHTAHFEGEQVVLGMSNVDDIKRQGEDYILNTGSPHYVRFVTHLESLDIKKEGGSIRYSPEYREDGINVNFVQPQDELILVATYERGVEDETLSCGTGVTAAALASKFAFPKRFDTHVEVQTKGGKLKVDFTISESSFSDIYLIGPAVRTFKGVLVI